MTPSNQTTAQPSSQVGGHAPIKFPAPKRRSNFGGYRTAWVCGELGVSPVIAIEGKARDVVSGKATLVEEALNSAPETAKQRDELLAALKKLTAASAELHKQARGLWNELVSQGYAEKGCPLPAGFDATRDAIPEARAAIASATGGAS